MIFLRFHHTTDDITKRGRRSTESFNYAKIKRGPRFNQMLEMKDVFSTKDKFKEASESIIRKIEAVGQLEKWVGDIDKDAPKVSTLHK